MAAKPQIIRLLTLGDSGAGKSSLLLRYTQNEFNVEYMPTIGIDFRLKTVEIKGKTGQPAHSERLQCSRDVLERFLQRNTQAITRPWCGVARCQLLHVSSPSLCSIAVPLPPVCVARLVKVQVWVSRMRTKQRRAIETQNSTRLESTNEKQKRAGAGGLMNRESRFECCYLFLCSCVALGYRRSRTFPHHHTQLLPRRTRNCARIRCDQQAVIREYDKHTRNNSEQSSD